MLPCEGVFKKATATFIIGNNELCGGLPEFYLPNCISKSSTSRKINVMILSASVIFRVLGIAFILAFIYLCWLKKKVNEQVSSLKDDSCPNGILKDNETVVAVKVLHLVCDGALKSFIVECEASRGIKHRNLLKILTVCSSSDYQGNDFKALFYEYMDNASLERWLHPNATSSHGNELPKNLNFIRRINIAVGIGTALNYLHHQCRVPIVHCDLKPSNILLDAEMVTHVGDFGLAKFLLGSSLDTIANQMSLVGLKGTIGYALPEYAMGCEVSREGDVYSYSILLLEMFTGLSPTDDTFRDNLTLHSLVAKALPEQVLEITDIVLLQERDSHFGPYSPQHWLSESNDIFQECLVMVYDIGVACSHEVPGRRLSIRGVAHQLHQIREKLFALGLHEQDELLTTYI
ncbi:probable LRR receptor-like serine/threonine-protein kinase At3g47570 [Syzygium oleosum]|uniref:probable LRR receptor-like serine/threonine-protein kinase At3g47570 n=1 Tax=Syzygium oleosum TaxID=219896 RepID=UPI0024B881B1|nr:probable LRR receptor-like serine/threonine-protein kinase At3g47570 [Syzygium oleosum]